MVTSGEPWFKKITAGGPRHKVSRSNFCLFNDATLSHHHVNDSDGVETQVNFMCPTANSSAAELLVVKQPTMQVTDAVVHRPPNVLEVDVEKWMLLSVYGNR